jgi:hypothetical protein
MSTTALPEVAEASQGTTQGKFQASTSTPTTSSAPTTKSPPIVNQPQQRPASANQFGAGCLPTRDPHERQSHERPR